jgi:uncharacterized protein (TIGR02145 family)/uncharacterized repeat protein (TIGR02543 family)
MYFMIDLYIHFPEVIMVKKSVLFLSLLLLVVFLFLCVNTPNPFVPANAQAYLSLKDSQGRINTTLSVTEAVTDSFSVGISAYLNSYIDSVSVIVTHGGDIEAQFTIKKFASDIDTIWQRLAFITIGTRIVTAKAYFQGKDAHSITGAIDIIGKPISASISPKTASVKLDSSKTFVVNASGTGSIFYQWYHNESVISAGGASQTYTITNATMLASGTYICKVKDQWGDSAFSDTATLTVFKPNVKPVLSTKGALQMLSTETCSLTVSVTDPDSGQIDSISVVKAPEGSSFAGNLFVWTPPTGYLGTDSVRTDSVIFAAIDNGTPPLVDTLRAKIEVRAKGVAPTFTVTYDGNGNTSGAVPTDANAYEQGASVTVKANTGFLVKTNYTFAGWNTKADGSGTTYATAATLIMGTANDTLFAKWTLDIPKVTSEPGNKSVLLGQTAVLAVVASGANLQYPSQKGTTNITNSNSATYTTPATVIADSGTTYRCIVSNAAGADTTTVSTLIVTTQVVAPKVTTQPSGQSAPEGATATFTIVASGTSPQYQWQKGTSDIVGATSSSYTTPALAVADNATNYRCIVSNAAGKDTSTAATLTVTTLIIAPKVTTQPSNQSATEGSTATFAIVALGTTLQYQWQKGTTNITGANSASYTTLTLVHADSGTTYRCIVSNTAGKDTSTTATLTVTATIVAPKITTQPTNQSVVEGATATFTVVASGTSPQYQWQKGTANITGATAASYTTPATVLATDNGLTFRCIVSNTAGKDTSTAATLTVTAAIVAPVVTTNPANQSVVEGSTATFTVVASGTSPQYQWQNGTTNISGATSASYTTGATTLANSGSTYRCIVSNTAGKDTSTAATLTITALITAPVITTDPTNQSVVEGSTATFSVVASGTSPQYQWQKGTTNIASATSASYTTPATVLADNSSTYRCIVSNSAGKDTSTAATLAVTTQVIAPVVTTDPANQSVCAGQTATFTIVASGTSPQYQWQNTTANISGATSATYSTPVTTIANTGSTFRCIVSNSAGKDTSTAATLTVNALPLITTQPQSQTVCAGTSVTLSITATGSGTLSYQWKKGTATISGATSSSYTKSGLAAGDAGSYTCDVTSNTCTTTSNVAILTVNTAPSISAQPQPQTVCAGGTATFSVTATASGTLSYQWKNGTTAISGATASSYTKSGLATGDAGSYSCDVTSNTCTITSNAAVLTVNALPSISAQPVSQTACAGGSVTFSVTATGSGTLGYQWKNGTTAISGATASSYSKSGLATGDAGNYTCDVTSNTCTITSNAAALTVNTAPTISAQPAAQTVCVGGSVTFSVTAAGSGTLSYQWKKAGTTISGATGSSYTKSGLVTGDAGNFTCDITSNTCTITSNAAALTVSTPPSISAQPSSATLIKGQSVTLSVTATGSTPFYYQWIKDGSNIGSATNQTYAIPTITEANGATYAGTYSCLVTNGCGSGATSNDAVITIPQYLVSFDYQNGQNNLVQNLYQGPIGTLPTATYAGCNFKGWFTGKANNGTQLSTSTSITQNITYYARWTVTYNGYEYKTVRIGEFTWMAENLRTTMFNDGTTPITLVTGSNWNPPSNGAAYAMYGDLTSNYNIYGALYNFNAALSSIAPTGWHVASDNDWTSVSLAVGLTASGDSLKEAGSSHWATGNTATNPTGFTALPGGMIVGGGSYTDIRNMGYWWTSTPNPPYGTWTRYMQYNSSEVTTNYQGTFVGLSIRCVKD